MPNLSRSSVPDNLLPGPVLYWAMHGSARVICDGESFTIDSGRALWTPAGAACEVVAGVGDVVVPVQRFDLGEARTPTPVVVEAGSAPWLLWSYADELGYRDGAAAAPFGWRADPSPADACEPPPMPSSDPAMRLATRVRNAPAVLRPLAEEAAALGWSERTLQRRFVTETGLGVREWVRATRISIAARLLRDGEEVAVVARAVGYGTATGFARAFAAAVGEVPSLWRERASSGASSMPRLRAEAALPSHRTWRRVNGAHVALWIARGSATITIGEEEHLVGEGDAVILPAGTPNVVAASDGSLVLPVGYRSGASGGIGRLVSPAHFTRDENPWLVRAMVTAYTPLRGKPRGDAWAFDEILRRSEHLPAGADEHLVARAASTVALRGTEPRTIDEVARTLGVPVGDVVEAVRACAASTPANWLRMSRMSRARVHLTRGESAAAVGRILGYAHPPAFTRAFRDVYGAPPREVVGALR
ncbi:helix-turn-helix transcriptional regulator [Microbacterium gubbeenense]|uniref:helix-turn-helix transcriptional regulator n=1 Tax=Microbacterium gubbeenense TaxID=159896 RepID=UPI003F9B370A